MLGDGGEEQGVGTGSKEERKRWIPATVRCATGTFSCVCNIHVIVRRVAVACVRGVGMGEGAYHVDGTGLPLVSRGVADTRQRVGGVFEAYFVPSLVVL